MKRNKTAAGVWLTGAALVLALFCPLPVLAAARVTAAIPVTVRTEGADSAAICTVELTPLDNAPAPAQCRLMVKTAARRTLQALTLTRRGTTATAWPSSRAVPRTQAMTRASTP